MGHGFIRKIYRKKDINRIQDKLNLLGDQKKFTPEKYLNIRFFTTILIFICTLYIADLGYIVAPIVAILYYYGFYYLTILKPIKDRGKKLDREALHFFEILTLTLESGRNLENSLEITVCNVDSELSNEFKKALFETKFGKTLIEALEDMKSRIPSETINNIILNITQTDVFGNSILETMYNQIDFLRDKQILEIKGQINKIPNKISIISVLFIVPLILLLVLGPVLLQFLEL